MPKISASTVPSPVVPESWAQVWPILLLAVVIFTVTRWLAVDVPLERDEGEYAYIAQRMLHGEVPYRDVFNQKPPGVFLLYLIPVWLRGTSVAAIHLTVYLWTIGSAVFLFALVRQWAGLRAAAMAMVFFAVLTICPEWQALAANTELFMLLPLIAATWCAQQAIKSGWQERRSRVWWFAAGLLSMAAFFFKQIGLTNVGFLVTWAVWDWKEAAATRRWKELIVAMSWFTGGMLLLGSVVSLAFVAMGAGSDFFDCVLWHNFSYAGRNGWDDLRQNLSAEFFLQGPTLWGVWLLVFVALIGWRGQQRPLTRFLAAWIFFSFMGTAVGWYFRPHYFLQVAPAFAMACGVTLHRLTDGISQSMSAGRSALTSTLLVVVCLLPWGIPNIGFWFQSDPAWKSRRLYSINPFPESAEFASHFQRLAGPDETVLIVGSEPQMLFLAERKSATRYILYYPLMMVMPGVKERQQEALKEILASQPKVVMLSRLHASLLFDRKTPQYLNEQVTKLLKDREYKLVGFREFDLRRRVSELVFLDDAKAELDRRLQMQDDPQQRVRQQLIYDMYVFVRP